MKKIFAFILICGLLFTFSACGEKTNKIKDSDPMENFYTAVQSSENEFNQAGVGRILLEASNYSIIRLFNYQIYALSQTGILTYLGISNLSGEKIINEEKIYFLGKIGDCDLVQFMREIYLINSDGVWSKAKER